MAKVSILLEVSNLDHYTKLLQFCYDTGIHVPPVAANPFSVARSLNTLNRKPTALYKEFCGAENLTAAGTTNEEAVHATILAHVKAFNLSLVDGTVKLDASLQRAFQSKKIIFHSNELPLLATKAF